MIDLPPEQLAIVRRLLAEHVPECEVRAFGSRVTRKTKPHSDLDIALLGPVCLPIRVDVIDWHAISENFRNIIAAKFEILQNPARPDAESAKLEQAIKANLRGMGYGGGRK